MHHSNTMAAIMGMNDIPMVQCGPPSKKLVYKPHEYYSYKYNKP